MKVREFELQKKQSDLQSIKQSKERETLREHAGQREREMDQVQRCG